MINLMPSVRRFTQTITTKDGEIGTVTVDAESIGQAKRIIAQTAAITWPGCSVRDSKPEEVKSE